MLAMNWTKPSERPQLALAAGGNLQTPGTKVSASFAGWGQPGLGPHCGDSTSHLPAAPCPHGDTIRFPGSASRRRRPSLSGLPPSMTDQGGAQVQPQPCLETPLLLGRLWRPTALPAGALPESGAGAPCPLPGHPAHHPHRPSLTGPFPRSIPSPGAAQRDPWGDGPPRVTRGRPGVLSWPRGCEGPRAGAAPSHQRAVGPQRFAPEAFWALPRPVGRL